MSSEILLLLLLFIYKTKPKTTKNKQTIKSQQKQANNSTQQRVHAVVVQCFIASIVNAILRVNFNGEMYNVHMRQGMRCAPHSTRGRGHNPCASSHNINDTSFVPNLDLSWASNYDVQCMFVLGTRAVSRTSEFS